MKIGTTIRRANGAETRIPAPTGNIILRVDRVDLVNHAQQAGTKLARRATVVPLARRSARLVGT